MKQQQQQLIKDRTDVVEFALERLQWIRNHCKVNGNRANPHQIRSVAEGAIEEIERRMGE